MSPSWVLPKDGCGELSGRDVGAMDADCLSSLSLTPVPPMPLAALSVGACFPAHCRRHWGLPELDRIYGCFVLGG